MMAESATQILLYDDGCPMCRFQMKTLTWLDWFNTTSLLPLSHDSAADLAPGIDREQLLEAIHCVTRSGRILRGARALRFVSIRMPILVPLALVLWVPGVIWVAEHVYSWVSRNRNFLSKLFGCKQACALMPARDRGDAMADIVKEVVAEKKRSNNTSPQSSAKAESPAAPKPKSGAGKSTDPDAVNKSLGRPATGK